MRLLLPLTFLLTMLLVPAAAGQVVLGVPAIKVERIETAAADGNSTRVEIDFTRVCQNQGMVLDPQTAPVMILAQANWTVEGPSQGLFEQQVCSMEMEQTLTMTFTVHPKPSAFADTEVVHPFSFKVRADPAGTTPAIPEQHVPFTVKTAALPPAPAVVEEPERESPGLGLVGAIVALAALAFIARRR